MLKPRPSMHVPRFHLTPRDESELRQLGDALEREAVDQYERWLVSHRRRIDTTRWKAVRTQEDLHVYTERDDFRKTWRHESKQPACPGPLATLIQHSPVPMTFVTGTVQGALDDALFGNTFLDTPSLRMRDAYLEQRADDAMLLSVVDAPHTEDPFCFLGVTFTTRKSAVGVGSRPRELLLLTGVRACKTSTGERIGMAFHHSIVHDALPRHVNGATSVRADASMFAIYRQLDDGRLEVYMMDFCDLYGKRNLASFVTDKQAMAMLVPRANGCSAGVNKKLYWLMRERQRARLNDPERESITSHRASVYSVMTEPSMEVACCDICDSSFRGLGRSSNICQLCGETVCGKCSVTKRIAIDASTVTVEMKRFAFCVGCMHHAKQAPAADMAQQDLDELWMYSLLRSGGRGGRKKISSGDESDQTRPTALVD